MAETWPRAIWKFGLGSRISTVEMPAGAAILTVQMQGKVPTLWAVCREQMSQEIRCFRIYATGEPLPPVPGTYIATVQDDWLVWHVFEIPIDPSRLASGSEGG